MVALIIILLVIFVLDQFINRKLIKNLNIEESDLGKKYVNKLHKYGEGILYWTSFLVMILTINEFLHFRILIFIGMTILFAFRTIMKWVYEKERKTYLLSAITCVLFILGSVTYGMINYFNF
ncbi:DUF4181 domain-containing protein [Virgibacillus sp. SK37]|uniref:DUF4181 domain-containing protein n=1 Tax=Virgibacillus sp. SK37 TaxID=403957 RepID=UPI0004D161DF|nr:DUF4181 domain-containing protein [Virgibacillus sp. SK37]AIF45280.1 hypothetical protein X953_06405 [Virgibacillus sp. SK37]